MSCPAGNRIVARWDDHHTFIVDTGASNHVAPYGRYKYTLNKPIRLIATKGPIVVRLGVWCHLKKIGWLKCLLIPESPFLLSVDKLILDGFKFWWSAPFHCFLKTPNSTLIRLAVSHDVPIFQNLVADSKSLELAVFNEFVDNCILDSQKFLDEIILDSVADVTDGVSLVTTIGAHHLTHLPADPDCRVCAQGKMRRKPARRKPSSRNVATRYLQKVCADCVGPNSVASQRGNKYALVFRDEFTGRVWTHALHSITAAKILACFKHSFRSQIGLPETVRSDGGPEFKGVFNDFCVEKGVATEFGLPNNPQTKGRGENFHGVMNNGIRAALCGAGVSCGLWDYALLLWTYNYNYSVKQPLTGKTPAVSCKLPVSSVLVPFGCFALLAKEPAHHSFAKWDKRCAEAIVVGYAENGGYLLFELNAAGRPCSRVRSSRNVRIYPGKFPMSRVSQDQMFDHFDLEHLHPTDHTPEEMEVGEIAPDVPDAVVSRSGSFVPGDAVSGDEQDAAESGIVDSMNFEPPGSEQIPISESIKHEKHISSSDNVEIFSIFSDGDSHQSDQVEVMLDNLDEATRRVRRQLTKSKESNVPFEMQKRVGSDLSPKQKSKKFRALKELEIHKDWGLDKLDDDRAMRSAIRASRAEAQQQNMRAVRSSKQRYLSKSDGDSSMPRGSSADSGMSSVIEVQELPTSSTEKPKISTRPSKATSKKMRDQREINPKKRDHERRREYLKRGRVRDGDSPSGTRCRRNSQSDDGVTDMPPQSSNDDVRVSTKRRVSETSFTSDLERTGPRVEGYDAVAHNDGILVGHDDSDDEYEMMHNELSFSCKIFEDQNDAEDSCRPRIEKFLAEIDDDGNVDHFQKANVVKWITPREAQWKDPNAKIAFDKSVLRWSSVEEWKTIREKYPNARVLRLNAILGIRNFEKDSSLHDWKARIVAGGRNIRTVTGERAEAERLYGSPVPLAIARLVIANGVINGHPIEVADIDGAYLTAPLRGDPCYGRVPHELRPEEWGDRYVDPVVRLDRSLCGLPRAGFDWYYYFCTILQSLGWQPVPEYDSLYTKGECVLAVYVDDLVMSGPAPKLRQAWKDIKSILKLKAGGPMPLEHFLNIKYAVERIDDHERRVTTDQRDYAQLLLTRFMEDAGVDKLREVLTPSIDRYCEKAATVDEYLETEKEVLAPGIFAKSCRKHIGGLLWLARASRPDLSFAVLKLAKQSHCWTLQSDEDLKRIFQYLQSTLNYCLVETLSAKDRGSLFLTSFADADWASCPITRKSTSGTAVYLSGKEGSSVLLEWGCKSQTFVARSSAEEELVALSGAMASFVLGVCQLLNFLQKDSANCIHLCDAEAAIKAVEHGSSPTMRHLPKTQGVHLAWLRGLFEDPECFLMKVPTTLQKADIFTKSLAAPRFIFLRNLIGMKKISAKIK